MFASPSRPSPNRRTPGWSAGLAAAALLLTGCATATDTGTRSHAPTVAATPTVTTTPAPAPAASPTHLPADASATSALATLATLPIKGRAPKTGYDRELFGPAWSDDVDVDGGHNGCDTRNDILRRDLVDITYKTATRDCVVLFGTLHDAYTGTTIDFRRGQDTSADVQIDHVVALSDAWQKGAQQLDEQTRANFANDPRNLQAVDGAANQQKGDGDAATWLPPNRSYRCTYVARQIEVKALYRLWVTQAEHDAMVRVLAGCGAAAPEPAPAATTVPEPVPSVAPEPAPAPGVAYRNCAEARAAGAAPLYAGQPGYSEKMDGDGDGVACE
ncbi:GmrSD restriction endonuclease domain-containing protein [Rhodococcus indonesiensis]